MKEVKLKAEVRQKTGGKGILSGLRRENNIPAIIYGAGKDPVAITVFRKDLESIMKMGSNVIANLEFDGKIEKAILKEVSHHVVSGSIIHADFQRIDMAKKLDIVIPILLKGIAPGIKKHGAILDHITREVHIKCLPADMPHDITVDISTLDIGTTVTAADLAVPKGVDITDDPSKAIVHLIVPRGEVIETPVAVEGEAAQPEVIEKGKKEEEGKDAAATDKKAKEPSKEKGK